MTVLYKNLKNVRPDRKKRNVIIEVEERPQRPVAHFRSSKDRAKYIKKLEKDIRRSLEYKVYVNYFKHILGMNGCAVFPNIVSGREANGKKYTVEAHHEPFTLFDIVNAVMTRQECELGEIKEFPIIDEVLRLHYDGMVGLISLSKTVHELVGDGLVFIPLQWIYHDYNKFFEMYEDYIDENTKEKVMMKAEMSLKCDGQIMSDVLEPEFTYMTVKEFGKEFPLPEVPQEWVDKLNDNYDNSLESLVVSRKQSVNEEKEEREEQ